MRVEWRKWRGPAGSLLKCDNAVGTLAKEDAEEAAGLEGASCGPGAPPGAQGYPQWRSHYIGGGPSRLVAPSHGTGFVLAEQAPDAGPWQRHCPTGASPWSITEYYHVIVIEPNSDRSENRITTVIDSGAS